WQQWTEVVSQQQAELRSPQILLSRGVDYMQSAGKFCPGRGLALEVGQRWLTARAYLLAADFFTPGPPVAGLTQNFYTPETLHSLAELPQRLAVLGGTPAALAIAQLFACLGSQVTIFLEPTWLNQQDLVVGHWLMAQLEAEGIEIGALSEISKVIASPTAQPLESSLSLPKSKKADASQSWQQTVSQDGFNQSVDLSYQIQLPQTILTVDQLIVATAPSLRSFDLGLEAIGVKQDSFGPVTSDRLQTIHPRIFALGAALGRQGFRAIAPVEIEIALKNALLLPRFELDRRALVWSVTSAPEITGVGITTAQARAWYADQAWVFTQPLYQNDQAQLLDQASGFCQLIVHRQGEILGAQIAAAQSSELIQLVAQAIAARQTIRAILRSPHLPHSLTVALVETAQQWQTRQLSVGSWRRDWLENWFNWRRSQVQP
ncbi:MAG: FAD-dependent oxidoreductase, partial [Leptolyngbyaceae cyanobacterium SL_1_1]|nr:FAD-dependent oxidoreductase [Leptolyngbyaceae cyanobacterium SL_1_1]